MNARSMLCLVALSCGLQVSPADILDDVGIAPADLLKVDRSRGPREGERPVLEGLPLSDAHAKELEAAQSGPGHPFMSFSWAGFFEGRGEFDKALTSARGLDKVRILVRAGRPAQASAALTDELVASLSAMKGQRAAEVLQGVCRPLEDAGAWEALGAFLAVVEGKLTTPAWKTAVWAEELDVAWHLDQVPKLLSASAGKGPFKLCVLHSRLGNTQERERLMAPLAAKADPDALLSMMEIQPGSAALEAAGIGLWKSADLPMPQRQQLWVLLDGMVARDEFVALFGEWIDRGGDAAPLATVIWEQWIRDEPNDLVRKPLMEKLVQRWPDEPRFAILLGRVLAESSPERAVQLFENAARGTMIRVPKLDPYQWYFINLRSIPQGALGDPTYVALGCLGAMHRQDRIQPLLGKSFGELPGPDRARYLAATGMDRDFVSTVLEADPTKVENEALPELLVRVLTERAKDRSIPPEILTAIAKKFPELVLGSPERKDHEVTENARKLFEVLVENKVDPALMKEQTARLMEAVAKRGPSQEKMLGFWLRVTSQRAIGYQEVVPPEKAEPAAQAAEKSPEYQEAAKAQRKAWEFQQVLDLFAMPEIRRIGSGVPDRSRTQSSLRSGPNPLGGLERWIDRLPEGMPPPNAEMVAQVMRSLGKDDPRRVPAEILITAGTIHCSDAALKEEAEASVQALFEGKKEARGTELFRFSHLTPEGREGAALLSVLEDVVILPPVLQRAFLRNAAIGNRPGEGPPELVYQFMVDPAAVKEGGFREEGVETRLMNMARAGQDTGGLALEYAEKVLDRQLVSAAMQRGRMMMRGGFDPRRRAMQGGEGGQAAAKVAIEVLRKQGKLEVWRERVTAKLEIFGMSAPEIERWFNGLEGTPGAPAPARGVPVPGTSAPDPQQAAVLLREALKTRDPEQIVAVFRKISNGRPELIADSHSLDALGPGGAPALLEAIMAAPIIGRGPDMNQAGLLHLYFLDADPSLAATSREWLAAQMKWQFRKEAGPVIADQLASVGAREEAVEVVLRPLVVPSERSGDPSAFPLKQGSKRRPNEDRVGTTVYEADIEVLAKWKLLDAAVKRAQELDVAPLEVAVLKMAKEPTATTFETEAVPLLAELDNMIRFNQVSRWENSFKKRPDASGLVIRLLEERSYRSKTDTGSMGFSIREMSQYPGSSATIGRIWQRMSTELKEGQRKDQAAKDARRLVSAMALAADDETWKNYWAWRSSDPEPIGPLEEFPLNGGMEEGVPPERARQVMAKSVHEVGLIGDPDQAFGWVATVLATGDQELLKAIREKISGDAPEVAAFCSQALGRPAGVFPLLEAARLSGGEVGLSWNLVTYDSRQPEPEVRDLPMAKVPAMDGKFDLEILAGKTVGKLDLLQKVPAAPNKSSLKLKLSQDLKFFALRFTEPGTGRPRETVPVELQENRGLVPLPAEAELFAKGMARKREAGPSGSPAYQVHLGHHGEVEIANLEWSGGESFQFDAWISGGGMLEVEFLDEEGKSIQRRDEGPMDAFRMAWQKRGLTLEALNIPARTARLRFSYHGRRQTEGAHYFSVSDARILRTPSPELPPGFEKIAKAPGRPTAIALSPDGKRIALGMDDGRIAVADLKSGKVVTSREELSLIGQDIRFAVTGLCWLGDELHSVDKKERLRRIDTRTMAARLVRQFKNHADEVKMHVTPDGKWLAAWINGEHLLLVPAGGGAVREMPLGAEDGIRAAPEGIYLLREGRRWELLKTADFAQGQAAEVATPEMAVDRGGTGELQVPRLWEGRLRLGESLPARTGADGQTIISLPVAKEVAFDPKDGTIYYADSRGIIVRVNPSQGK